MNLIQQLLHNELPSVYIELPEDDLFFSEGLVDFVTCLGVISSEIKFELFEDKGQKNRLKFVPSSITKTVIDKNKITIFYSSIDELDGVLRSYLGDFEKFEVNQLERVVYEKLEHLWTFHGTGYKVEANPKQHLDFSFQINNDDKSKELLKSLCYMVFRLGLNSTSFQFPLINNDKAVTQFHLLEGKNETLTLKEKNTFLLISNNVASVLKNIALLEHVSEGGIWHAWSNPLAIEQDMEEVIYREWSSPSEATRILQKVKGLKDDVEVFLTSNAEQRREFKQRIKIENEHLGDVKTYSAFKSGFYWLLEEVTPLYSKVNKIDIYCKNALQDGNLELANRWVMEMYPIDEILSDKFQISKDAIQFHLVQEQEEVYKVVIDEQCHTFSPLIDTFYYVDEIRKVSPTTAGVRCGDEHWIIDTDRKNYYQFILKEIMPEIESFIDSSTGNGITSPLFEKLELEFMSAGIEEELPVKNELNSSMEALYEDLYFNILDYFKIQGTKKNGKPYTSPGGIMPKMYLLNDIYENVSGKVTLYKEKNMKQESDLNKISFDDSGEIEQFHFTNDHKLLVNDVRPIEVPEHLKCLESDISKVVYVGYSYQNRPIFAVECTIRNGKSFINGLKKSTYKHTIMIETGHHANEVSSIPAAKKLIQSLQNEHIELLEKLNVVIVLNANPDGEALLLELTKEHPKWKHHAARFNAVGLEFAHLKFLQSEFGEADVLPKLLKKWAPDIVIDNHGIPAHEWVQPFAGYTTPPLFPVSYNIPSAKIYGIGRYLNTPFTNRHFENLKVIENQMNEAFKDTLFAEENKYWRERFIKYGTQFVPDKYLIEGKENINFYTELTVTPEYPTVSIFRYPSWISADIITEVADEVVYGDELASCAEAHYLFNLTVLQLVQQSPITHTISFEKVRPISLRGKLK